MQTSVAKKKKSVLVGTAIKALKQAVVIKYKLSTCNFIPTLAGYTVQGLNTSTQFVLHLSYPF